MEKGTIETRGFSCCKVVKGLAVYGVNGGVVAGTVEGSNQVATALANHCKNVSGGCMTSLQVQILENRTDIDRFILLWAFLQLPDTRTKDTGRLLRQLAFFRAGSDDKLKQRWDQERDISARWLFLDVDIHEVKDAILEVGSLTLGIGI